jgi:plasmid stabilization system protein ParE
MVVKILWTEGAINDLKDIFDYYKYKAGRKTALKITNAILKKPKKLKKNPEIGQKETLLSEISVDMRYLVEGNYKIVYWSENELIYIATVFDCRQNPDKLLKSF